MKSIFLSHSHLDRAMARQIYLGLTEQGVRCWLDEAEIKPGESIIAKIEQAIDEMDYLGIILTPASVNSVWVTKELQMALVDEIESRNVRVIGLLLTDCKFPGFLRDKKYIDFRSDFQSAMTDLINFLRRDTQVITIPKQAILAKMIETADKELWHRLGGERLNQRATANLVRYLTEEELDAAVAIGAEWKHYKQWESDLLNMIQEYVDTDNSGAGRILRRLLELGILDEARDLDYTRQSEQAYIDEDLLIVIKRAAARSGLYSYFPPPYPETLSAFLACEDPVHLLCDNWSAVTYGVPFKTNLLGGLTARVIVTRDEPPKTWIFATSADRKPKTISKRVNLLYVTLDQTAQFKLRSTTDLFNYKLAQFDDLKLLT